MWRVEGGSWRLGHVWYMVGAETSTCSDVIRAIPSSIYQGHWDTSGRRNTTGWKASPRQLSKRAAWQSSGKGVGVTEALQGRLE